MFAEEVYSLKFIPHELKRKISYYTAYYNLLSKLKFPKPSHGNISNFVFYFLLGNYVGWEITYEEEQVTVRYFLRGDRGYSGQTFYSNYFKEGRRWHFVIPGFNE